MKIIITEEQLINITETITNGNVKCDKCKWEWSLKDGRKDKYICHKCGHDNKPVKDDTAKFIKCRECKKFFTQTIHKKKKSLPICPHCGAHH